MVASNPSGGHVKAAAPKVKGSFTMRAVNQAPVASSSRTSGQMSSHKKQKPMRSEKNSSDDDDDDDGDIADIDESEVDASEADTDEEIAAAQASKSKKTAKRKRRATSPETFGAVLSGLLGDDENSDSRDSQDDGKGPSKQARKTQQPAILSLAPHIRRSAESSRLNAKAARLALEARRKREDRAHVTDVIGGWGAPGEPPKTVTGDVKTAEEDMRPDGEKIREWLQQGGVQGYEKRLRKAAQRGVVKLFNAIRAAQNTTEEDLAEQQQTGSSKASSAGNEEEVKVARSAPVAVNPANANVSLKKGENALGGKARAVNELSKSNFFDLIRGGSATARV